MDTACKATLTAALVAAVLLAARLLGRRAAGMLAGLPVITLPALAWLVHEQGAEFAAHSAIGSLAACAMAPLFAAAYTLLAAGLGPGWSLAGAACVAAVAALALHKLEPWPLLMLLAALASSRLVLQHSRRQVAPAAAQGTPGRGRSAPARASEPWATAGTAAVVSTAVAWLAGVLGPYWAGVLATLPLISACVLVHLHRVAGRVALPGFVGGYVVGIAAKALFVYAFVVAVPLVGAQAAFLAAGLAGTAGAWLFSRQQALPAAGPVAPLPARRA